MPLNLKFISVNTKYVLTPWKCVDKEIRTILLMIHFVILCLGTFKGLISDQ